MINKLELNIHPTPELLDALRGVVSDELKAVSESLSQKDYPIYLNRKEAAELLGITLPTLRDWVVKGHIPEHRIAHRIRYIRQELDAAIQNTDHNG